MVQIPLKDGAGDELQTQPENDAPAQAASNLTPEQVVLLNVMGEKQDDINAFINVLNITNQVEEGQTPPYNGGLLEEAEYYLKKGFVKLEAAVKNGR